MNAKNIALIAAVCLAVIVASKKVPALAKLTGQA